MLTFIAMAIAVLTAVPFTAAVPTDLEPLGPAPFSFEKWADAIISNPTARHMSPIEAVEASVAARSVLRKNLQGHDSSRSQSGDNGKERRTTFKKAKTEKGKVVNINTVQCNTFPQNMAPAHEAAWCIEFLAKLNQARCDAPELTGFCRAATRTFIVGWRKNKISLHQSTCSEIARTAGKIMDACTNNGFVQGETAAWNDTATGVMIRTFDSGFLDQDMKVEM